MHIWLNLKAIKFYLIKSATDVKWQPSFLVGEKGYEKKIVKI